MTFVETTAALHELEDLLRASGAPVAENLAPGATEDHIRTVLAEHGMEPSGDVLAWYTWHNGLIEENPPSNSYTLIPFWYPSSLAQARQEYLSFQRGTEDGDWLPTWWPIGYSIGPARKAADCTPPQGETGRVRLAMWEAGLFDEAMVPSVQGLARAVRAWSACMRSGLRFYSAEAEGWDKKPGARVPAEHLDAFIG